jgi:tetratricopeptide (TPR) repeat protein
MVHMPGHIWVVLGDWEMAASVNERAATVDREYFAATQVSAGSYEPYYLHNLHFIMYARSMQGHRAQALHAAATLAASSGDMGKSMPEMADSFSAQPLLIRARFNDWATVLNTAEPNEKMVATQTAWAYVRTLALQAHGDTAGAQRQNEHFEQLRSKLPADAPWGQNKAADVMRLASESLAAHLAPNLGKACEHWRQAVDIQDHFVYDEPPAWYYPVRESLGGCLLRAGKTAEATEAFREGVHRSPRNGRMLFGLWQSLKAQGDTTGAEFVRREFEAAWSGADVTLRLEDL